MSDKAKEIIRDSLGYLLIALFSVIYILTAVFVLDSTGKTIGEIIGDGILSFVFGLSINRFFDLQGMLNGEKHTKMLSTIKEHSEVVNRITPYFHLLDGWCELQNENNYKIQRSKILSRAGLEYSDYFDENGVAKPYESKLEKIEYIPNENANPKTEKARRKEIHKQNKQKVKYEKYRIRCYWTAVKLKLTTLTSGMLTSEGGNNDDIFDFGITRKQYETTSSISDIISKLIIAFCVGVYGIKLIKDFSWFNLLWTGLQVAIFLVFGVIKMIKAFLFMINEFRGRIIKKIDNLEKFECYAKEQSNGKDK